MTTSEANNKAVPCVEVDAFYFVVLKKFVINRKSIGGVFPFSEIEAAQEFLGKVNSKPTEFHFELLTTIPELGKYCEAHGLNFRDYLTVKRF